MKHKLTNILKLFFVTMLVVSLGCFFVACGGNVDKPETTTKYTVTVVNGTGGGEYEENTDVTITATIPEGKVFEKWTSDGADVSTDNPYTFKATKDITLTAVFDEPIVVKYTVTVIGGEGSGEYEEGEQVVVTTDVGAEEVFTGWTSDGVFVSNDNPYTFTATADITLTAVKKTVTDYAEYTTTLDVEDGEDFVILNLTDFQLHDGKSTYTAFAIIDELVAETNPDLITVLGDTAEDATGYDTITNFTAIVNYIDALGIPWAPIYGNHDNDNYHANNSQKSVDSEWINNVFTSAENCVFKVGPDSVNGNGNYIVNVVNSSTNEIVKSLIFVDSGVSGVDSTHVTFYENAVEYCKYLNGGDVPESIVFLHIPLPEYKTLYNSGNYEGIAGETPSSNGTTAFFTKIKDFGSTTHVICGHDHTNSFYGEYQGVYLMYCLKSSDGDYFNDDQLGGTTFTIGADTTFEYHFLSVPYEVTIDSTSFAVPSVSKWKTSGKSISFEYKKTTLKTSGETLWFSFVAGKSRILPKYNDGFRLSLDNNTLKCGGASFEGHYTVEDIGDGWYRLTIDLEAIPLVGSVTGKETINGIYFYWVAHKMLFYNAQVV